jgi:hypothetical protein
MQTLVGLLVFIALVGLGLWGLQAGGAVPQATIIFLSAAVTVAVWGFQENAKQRAELEAKLGSDKRVLYKLYLDILRDILGKSGEVDPAASAAYITRLRLWVYGALLNASDDVLLAHNRFLNAHRISDEMAVPAIADVILAMRRDAGEGTTGLRTIDILGTVIKPGDTDKLRPLCDQWEREKDKAWPSGPPTL